jgi:hypothetical protein
MAQLKNNVQRWRMVVFPFILRDYLIELGVVVFLSRQINDNVI